MTQKIELGDEREAVSNYGRKMLEQNLTEGTGGNVSSRRDDKIAISPTGVPYDDIEFGDVPLIDLDGKHIKGDLTPSSEHRLHSTLQRELDDVTGVVHTHSPYASTFASLGEPIRPTNYLIAFGGKEIPVTEYATYGTKELANQALRLLRTECDVCLLRNHGLVAVGDTVDEAYERALMVEASARVHYQAKNIGEPSLMPEEEVEYLRDAWKSYGQSTDSVERTAPAPDDDELLREREMVADLGREMLDKELTQGTGGNVSARNGDSIAISPSGIPYEEVTSDNVAILNTSGEQIAGELRASNEAPMHTAIYRERDDVNGIVHTHSPYASTFAGLDEPIRAAHYLIAFAGEEIPVTDYDKPGSEALGRLAVEELGNDYNACLLKNHGVITVGETVEAAFETALMVEYCARIHYQALGVGEPEVMSSEELDTLSMKFKNYGQSAGK